MDAITRLKADFIKEVESASSRRFIVDVFTDLVRAMAISIESPLSTVAQRKRLEDEYMQIRGKYDDKEFEHFPRAFGIVMNALQIAREDFLGHALEHIGASNTHNGQYLTPVCISRMMAKLQSAKVPEDYKPGKIITINDPACGSSVLLIESAEALHNAGVRGDDILIIASDIDRRACDISYVQMSLLGYAAIVKHMDTMSLKCISPERFTLGYYSSMMPIRHHG